MIKKVINFIKRIRLRGAFKDDIRWELYKLGFIKEFVKRE